ncbi:TonB-dependent receptor [Mariniphaga sp.]|uniref:TonB-dependent receptor n=1 Tax=Mariniphaga sp. TaxID=1954475 RepID=UPI00356A62ED
MKRTIIFILLFSIALTAVSQSKKRGRVKRKYRNVEQVSQNLPQVIMRGLVRDAARIPIAGAGIEIEGLTKLVHSNEFGQFMLSGLPTGRLRIRVSCLGYQTRTIDYVLQPGFNDHYFTLERGSIPLETEIATTQNREKQISDIPAAVSVSTQLNARILGITDFSELAVLEPGLHFEKLGAGNSGFSIQGANASSGFPGLSPSVAVFADQVPVSQPGGFSAEWFDMERVEILKGPQNVLFARNALNGAVHFISKKPEDEFGGYISAGAGNFSNKEIQAAVNYPIVEDKLFVRAAGIFHDQNGYVENTFGGTLNGKNVLGGRFSVRFLPAWNHKIDLQLNYQKSDDPGTAFINLWVPDENGETGLFDYRASLNRGEDLGSEAERMDATLTYRFFRDEHNYWTSVTSFRKNNTAAKWDADGTSFPALEMNNETNANLFYQEIRYNFMRGSFTNGSFGLNYFQEKGNLSQSLISADEMINQILSSQGNFTMPGQSRFPVQPKPLNPNPMANFPLSGNHNEAFSDKRKTHSAQAFLHYTYQWRRRLFFTIGASAIYDRLQLNHESEFSGGETSSLGQFSGAAPNLIYSPAEQQELKKNSLSFTGQAGLTYRWNENFNFYLNAARGRRPQVLQFTWDGKPLITGSETVYSGEGGWKTIIKKRIFWDVNGFYRRHFNVQTLQWNGEPGTALLAANGKATSYGAETGLKVAVIPGLNVFGNYAWMQSAFDSTGLDGKDFLYAANSFARAPEHSFSAGFSAKARIVQKMWIFAAPWYAWQSHFWFTEANTPGIEQPAYGVLNVNFGIEMADPDLVLSIYGTNLLEEKYIASAGHWGGQFGMPTFVPGAPRMFGAKLTWRF